MLLEEKSAVRHDYKYSKALAEYGKDWNFEELNGLFNQT